MVIIYARKCKINSLEDETADLFLETHHKQGTAITTTLRKNFGLFYKNELVGVAVFDNPRTKGKQRKYTTELNRLAFKTNTRVVGGASKLIKNFLKKENPISLFTYQSTSGEVTDVYKHAGMTLVEEAKPKNVLVIDGKTFETAENNRHDWFSIEQVVRYGIDNLLGTSFGTIIEDENRVSNVELFLRNGYHLEEVSGDRVYEWLNPSATHYLYKITSTKDNGYYIGRHSTKENLTIEEAKADGYWGSGGAKFRNWVKKIGKENLVKEVLGLYPDRESLIKAEEKTIGENYKLPECKNTRPGGLGLAAYGFPPFEVKLCLKHGKVKHMGAHCSTCLVEKTISHSYCNVCQKTTTHQGKTCTVCVSNKVNVLKTCKKHGLVGHKGGSCNTCAQEKILAVKKCNKHGLVQHLGSVCSTCNAEKGLVLKICKKHGEVWHRKHNGECISCSTASLSVEKYCGKHGWVGHKGDSCNVCSQEGVFKEAHCKKHGLTTHQTGKCSVCIAESSNSMKDCEVHGVTAFIGERCRKCISEAGVEKRFLERLDFLSNLGFDEEGIKKAFENSSQSGLVKNINIVAGENVISRPYLRKVLNHYNLL